MMWDDRRQAGVLTGFESSRLADKEDSIGGGTTEEGMPFRALNIGSWERMHGKIPLLYRHNAESFAWSLIYLCLSVVEDEDGKNRTRRLKSLEGWFDPRISSVDKMDLNIKCSGSNMAYPNTEKLAYRLRMHWVRRHLSWMSHFLREIDRRDEIDVRTRSESPEPPPCEELDDESVFAELLAMHQRALDSSEVLCVVKEEFARMRFKYQKIDWSN
jgi:hypothetical protein